MAIKQRVALIDADSLVYLIAIRQYEAGNRTMTNSVKVNTRTFMNNIIANANSSHYIVFVQGVDHQNYRKTEYPAYKKHRIPNAAVNHWKPTIIEALEEFNTVVLRNIESDDAVNIYSVATRAPYIIVTNDKDLNGIPGIHFNPFQGKLSAEERWTNVTEDQATLQRWAQILAGDGTDASLEDTGIEGIGMGKKGKPGKAQKMLQGVIPSAYNAVVAKAYMDKYGVVKGLERMALTYRVIHILEEPREDLPESLAVLRVTPKKHTNSTKGLFND